GAFRTRCLARILLNLIQVPSLALPLVWLKPDQGLFWRLTRLLRCPSNCAHYGNRPKPFGPIPISDTLPPARRATFFRSNRLFLFQKLPIKLNDPRLPLSQRQRTAFTRSSCPPGATSPARSRSDGDRNLRKTFPADRF